MRGLFNDQMFRLAWNQCRRHNYNNYTNFGLINEIYFYDKYIDTIILDIINRINNKKYCFSTKYIVYIPKSNGLARRISVTTLEDQLVMQVILNYIAKKSDKNFIKASYGNRYQYKKGKLSTNIFKPYYEQFNKFINAIIYNIEQGYNWVGETDITAFHDTIAHTEIENSLKQYLNNADMQDRYIKKLIADFLKTDVIEHNERKKIIRGIPQGVELSNFLGNLVLDEIDKKMIQLDNIVYLRYVDDIRILGKSEESVREALIYLQKILLCRELYINNAKTKIYNVDLSLINKDKLRRLQREKLSIDKMKEIQFEEIEEDEEKNFDELKRMAERRNYLIKNYLIKKIYKEERYFHHIEDILDTNPKHYYLVKEIRKYRNKLPKNKIKNVYNKFLKNSYEVIKAPLIADTFDYYRDIEIDVDIKKIGEIQSINILMQEISIQDILKQLVRHVLTMDKYAINIGMKATICLLKEIECSDKWKQKVLEKLISSDIIFNDTNLFIDILFADNINNKRISSYINEHYNYTHQKYSKNSTHNTRETLFDKLKDKPIDFSTIKNIIKQIRLDLPESYCKNPGLINPYNITVNIGLDDKVKVNYLEDDKINIENKTPEDFLLMNVGNNYRITYMLGLIWFCLFTKEPMKIYNEIVPYIQFSPTKYKNKADIFEEMYFNYKERFEYELELIASLTKKSLAHRISIDKIFNMIENKKENLVKGKNEMKEINILHLSDLHFGMEPFKDTENEINSTKVAERVLTLKSLKKSLKDLTEEWKPQILVISGDIGWKGHEQDYIEAEEWITKLRNELNIKDIVVCPG